MGYTLASLSTMTWCVGVCTHHSNTTILVKEWLTQNVVDLLVYDRNTMSVNHVSLFLDINAYFTVEII